MEDRLKTEKDISDLRIDDRFSKNRTKQNKKGKPEEEEEVVKLEIGIIGAVEYRFKILNSRLIYYLNRFVNCITDELTYTFLRSIVQ